MENVKAEIIKDSIGRENDVRATTLLLTYPRYIHQELMTHRAFSRNAASSRAVPLKKMIQRVRENPATFEFFGKNKPGMQATEEMSTEEREYFETAWVTLGKFVSDYVETVSKAMKDEFGSEPHKQMINRALEPWLHMQTLVTATEWENFFNLRDHKDAQPEIQVLARKIKDAMNNSSPEVLNAGEWHIPFITDSEAISQHRNIQIKIATARCARTSYYFHDGGVSTIDKDIELHDKLVGSEPKHSSPAEHILLTQVDDNFYYNVRGFIQYRWFLDKGVKLPC